MKVPDPITDEFLDDVAYHLGIRLTPMGDLNYGFLPPEDRPAPGLDARVRIELAIPKRSDIWT